MTPGLDWRQCDEGGYLPQNIKCFYEHNIIVTDARANAYQCVLPPLPLQSRLLRRN